MALTFDQLSATTYKNHQKTLVDNIMKKIAVLAYMQKAGKVSRSGGGTTIVEPLLYGVNTTAKSYAGRDVIDTSPQDGISAAEYTPKNVAVTVEITKEQEDQNKGVPRLVDLLKSKFDQADKSLRLVINQQVVGDGTGNSSKDFSGLKSYIKYNVTASVSVGGINQATYSWWRNQIGITTAFATSGIAKMKNVWNKCIREGDVPDVVFCDQTSFEAYEDKLVAIERIMYNKGSDLVGDLGFTSLAFNGRPIVFDYHIVADTTDSSGELGRMYFVTTEYLKLRIDPDTDFVLTEWKKPYAQILKGAQILVRGELTCSNRQQQGILTITGW